MPEYLITATFDNVSGFTEDNFVNSFFWHNDTPVVGAGSWGSLLNSFHDFYNGGVAGAGAIFPYLSPVIDRLNPGITWRVYDISAAMGGQPHGSPIHTETRTIQGAAPAQALPCEVALCLTLRGTNWQTLQVEVPDSADAGTEPDRPRQRQSGRLYIGPFGTNALRMVNGQPRPVADLETALIQRSIFLAGAVTTAVSSWGVWSRKNSSWSEITHVQVDNAFDTQRRRGIAPTLRTTQAV